MEKNWFGCKNTTSLSLKKTFVLQKLQVNRYQIQSESVESAASHGHRVYGETNLPTANTVRATDDWPWMCILS